MSDFNQLQERLKRNRINGVQKPQSKNAKNDQKKQSQTDENNEIDRIIKGIDDMQSRVVDLGKKVVDQTKDSQEDEQSKKGAQEFNSEYKRMTNFGNNQPERKSSVDLNDYKKQQKRLEKLGFKPQTKHVE